MAAVEAQATFVGAHLAAYLVQVVLLQYGLAALFGLYAGPATADVGGALRRALRLWPRLLLAAVLVGVPGALGMLLIVPGLLIFGRTIVPEPARGAEPGSAVGAVARSLRLTRGSTLAVTGLAAVGFLLRLASWPFEQLDLWLRSLHAPNPVARAVIDGAGAGAAALAELGALLIAVAAYRALTAASKGI